MSRSQQGFTLVELMITVAILAIIAAVAVPSYSHFTRRAHLRDAQAALMENAYFMEQFYAQNNRFRNTDGTRPALTKTQTAHFNIAFSNGTVCSASPNDNDHYCMIATSKNANAEPRVLVLDEAGKMQLCQSNVAADAADCAAY
ncbi:MAG: type IV pilin protein [Neisseria sp.]|nr:type IV pilin protein [Neisseria sp.]